MSLSDPTAWFAISYRFYLTRCIALFVTVRAVDALVPVETLDIRQYWLHSPPVRQPSRAHSEAVS